MHPSFSKRHFPVLCHHFVHVIIYVIILHRPSVCKNCHFVQVIILYMSSFRTCHHFRHVIICRCYHFVHFIILYILSFMLSFCKCHHFVKKCFFVNIIILYVSSFVHVFSVYKLFYKPEFANEFDVYITKTFLVAKLRECRVDNLQN